MSLNIVEVLVGMVVIVVGCAILEQEKIAEVKAESERKALPY